MIQIGYNYKGNTISALSVGKSKLNLNLGFKILLVVWPPGGN